MGDRELPVVNRCVQRRWLRYTQGMHAERKAKAKLSIPTEPPPEYTFLSSRSKRNAVFAERSATIERDNLTLLGKMRHIMTERQMDEQEPFLKPSLNRGARKQELLRILGENEALLRRIQLRRPVYEVESFEREHAMKEYRLSRVGKFPYVSESMPAMTPPPLPTNRLVYFGHRNRERRPYAPAGAAATAGPESLPNISSTLDGGSQSARKAVPLRASSATARPPLATAPSTARRPVPPSSSSSRKPPRTKTILLSRSVPVGDLVVDLVVSERASLASGVAGLDFAARDAGGVETTLPAFVTFRDLARAFGKTKGAKAAAAGDSEEKSNAAEGEGLEADLFSSPSRGKELVELLLPRLHWLASPSLAPGVRQLALQGVEASFEGAPRVARGIVHSRLHLTARGLGREGTTVPPVAVLYAMASGPGAPLGYKQVAHVALTRSSSEGSNGAEWTASLVFPHERDGEAPLRMGIFEVGADGGVIASSSLGEAKWMARSTGEQRVRLTKSSRPIPRTGQGDPVVLVRTEGLSDEQVAQWRADQAKDKARDEEVEEPAAATARKPVAAKKQTPAKPKAPVAEAAAAPVVKAKPQSKTPAKAKPVVAAATPAATSKPSSKPASTATSPVAAKRTVATKAPAAEKPQISAPSDDAPSSSPSSPSQSAQKKLFQGGRTVDGIDLLFRAVSSSELPDGADAVDCVVYSMYFRPTSETFEHAVRRSDLPHLLQSLSKPCDSPRESDQAEALLELFTASKDAAGKVSVQFAGQDVVAWKDLKAEGAATAPVKAAAAAASTPSPPTPARALAHVDAKPAAVVADKIPLVDEQASVHEKVLAFDEAAASAANEDVSPTPAKAEEDTKAADEEAAAEEAAKLKQAEDDAAAAEAAAVAKQAADAAAAAAKQDTKAADDDDDYGDDLAVLDDAAVEEAAAEEAAKLKQAEADAAAAEAAAVAKQAADEAAAAAKQAADEAAAQAQAEAEAKAKADADAAAAEAKAAADAKVTAKAKADADKKAVDEQKAKDEAAAKAAAEQEEADAAAAAQAQADADAQKLIDDAAAASNARELELAKLVSDAKAAVASGPKPITLRFTVACTGLPLPAGGESLNPMCALYAEGADEQYAFASQTESKDDTRAPSFDTELTLESDENTPAAGLMLSLYHVVPGGALSEENMVGQALSTQGELQLALKHGRPLELTIQANGAVVANAGVTITNVSATNGHALKAAAAASSDAVDSYEVFVSCKNLKRVGADQTVSSMTALYAADAAGEFSYAAQTERLEDNANPVYETSIPTSGSATSDQALMFSTYHVPEGAEISADDQIGAATTTMRALFAATEAKPLKLAILKDDVDLGDAELSVFVKKSKSKQ